MGLSEMAVRDLKILFLASEAFPFAKTGGLADVTGSLPGAMKRLGMNVRLAIPFYRTIREADFQSRPVFNDLHVPLGREILPCRILETETPDEVPVYLVDRPSFYDRPSIYGEGSRDYGDNMERFCYFSHAVLVLAQKLSFLPDIIHCHDWQTGLIPALLKGPFREMGASSVFTIHNVGYKGLFPEWKWDITGLPWVDFFHTEGMEYWGMISLLKSGIVYSDAVTTVSPTYAEEIQRPEYGMGMDGILRHRKASLRGILNGADYRLWNPSTDPHIPSQYGPEEISGKKACKDALLREMNLDGSMAERPLLAVISRLDNQKGFDLLLPILDALFAMSVGLVVLGSGDGHIQWLLKEAEKRHNGRMKTYIGFNEPLAHRILSGADIFLNPSRYEPCGLTQIYALKYGTVPVVRGTGGLEDTVHPFDYGTGEGTGFKFYSYDESAFFGALREAVAVYYNPPLWRRIQKNGMQVEYSWNRSAREYLELYKSLLPAFSTRRFLE
ncbi:MAG: glycogen synthase GlgA [Desulfobacterales bacterium]